MPDAAAARHSSCCCAKGSFRNAAFPTAPARWSSPVEVRARLAPEPEVAAAARSEERDVDPTRNARATPPSTPSTGPAADVVATAADVSDDTTASGAVDNADTTGSVAAADPAAAGSDGASVTPGIGTGSTGTGTA